MRLLVWPLRVAIFFALFAFALNNQHETAVHWFFGREWRAPTIFIVLTAFALGCAFGVLAMVPSWWRHRRVARRADAARDVPTEPPRADTAAEPPPLLPPRDGV